MKPLTDFRTDTVTRPTAEMLAAMQAATQGDDSRDGDPTVIKLEALAASRTGKEAGLYMPSGTMTNLVAVLAHTSRAGEVLLERSAHMLNTELGGLAAVAGVFYKAIPGTRGAMDESALREAIRPMTRNNFGTALICMENTHNGAGGAVLPLAHMQMVHELARRGDKRIVFYCAFGERSAMAVQAAQDAGLTAAVHIEGGIDAWKKAGGALVKDA